MSKVVLITGGSSGIGKCIGEFLTDKGFQVYGTSRNPDNYANSIFPLVALDVTNVNSINTCIAEVIGNEGRLDVLINNAGAGITGPIEEIPEAEIKRNFETNFFGPINVIKAVLPQMRKQGSGLVINITSMTCDNNFHFSILKYLIKKRTQDSWKIKMYMNYIYTLSRKEMQVKKFNKEKWIFKNFMPNFISIPIHPEI